MTCIEAYKYLFIYAKNQLTGEKNALEAHLAECETCRNIAESLAKLIPTMTFAREDEQSHFSIGFPELGLMYIGSTATFDNYEEINAVLKENGGRVPDNMWLYNTGFNGTSENHLCEFDAYGREIEVDYHTDGGNTRIRQTKLESIDKCQWFISVMMYDMKGEIKPSILAPNLYHGGSSNYFGVDVKSALYRAVPIGATNVRIKRGNGVIDCGAYSFAYVDRYVTSDEGIVLEYSYNK